MRCLRFIYLVGTFIADLFKSRRRLEVENLFLRTFGESSRNTRPITMRFGPTSRSGRRPVPTANLKRLTATANRLILAPDERSLQVDLVRLDRTVPVASCVGRGDTSFDTNSTSAEFAADERSNSSRRSSFLGVDHAWQTASVFGGARSVPTHDPLV
jgi:hypothetical protein